MKKQNKEIQLSQKEDSLGVGGIAVLLSKETRSIESFPMLEPIYEKFAMVATSKMRNGIDGKINLGIVSHQSFRFSEYFSNLSDCDVFSIFKAEGWNNFGMFVIRGGFVYGLLEVMLGGGRLAPSLRVEGREFTKIELDMVRYLSFILVESLSEAFAPVANTQFDFERLETSKEFAYITKNDKVVNAITIQLKAGSRYGNIDLILPYNEIEPMRKLLQRRFEVDDFIDPVWSEHFEKEVYNTKIQLELRLNGAISKVRELVNLKIGDTVILDKFAEEDLDVTLNGVRAAVGKLGKSADKVAVQLTDNIDIAKFNHVI